MRQKGFFVLYGLQVAKATGRKKASNGFERRRRMIERGSSMFEQQGR